MVLAFRSRPSTKDVDAIFEPAMLVRELARRVAAEQELPDDWLNDGAKGFVSARHETTGADLPQFEGLRLTAPTPEYMLAMKCMAARIGAGPEDPGDVADIAFLISRLRLTLAGRAHPAAGGLPPRRPLREEDHHVMRRPMSLAEVAAWTTDRRTFHLNVADFIDEFRRSGSVGMLAAEPRRLRSVYQGGEVADAYLAAVAVSLAREIHEPPPAWAWEEDRKLRRPWFAWPGPALRATLLVESPAAFRERNLFVSANVLSRA